MMTAGQLRAARALLGIDQKALATMSGVSLPTIQRMEASDGTVRGTVETLTKVIEALNTAGVDLIGDNARSALVIDFSAVPFLDSTAANTIAGVARKSVRRGTPVTISGASASVRKSLKEHGVVPPLADYQETIADAVADVQARRAK
jgi:transcriptional regulator with XRE-family HTH domain